MDLLAPYPTLTDTQRVQAREAARRNLIKQYAVEPIRANYHNWTASRYPRWFVLVISAALVTVALSAGLISGFRLYYAGQSYFLHSIDNARLAVAVGVFTPLAAELLVIVTAIAGQVYLHGRGRLLSLMPVAVGMTVAFVGNWQITQPTTAWGWVETLFPPLAVLSVAFMAEVTFVPELERRKANELAYQSSRQAYDTLTANPESHDRWRVTYALALWDMWRKVYADRQPDALDLDTRRAIVQRELDAGDWLEASFSEIAPKFTATVRTPGQSNRALVEQFYRDHEAAFQMQQKDIAELLGISESAVSRHKPSQNGH